MAAPQAEPPPSAAVDVRAIPVAAGPDALGRNLILRDGYPPPPWQGCEVLDIDDPQAAGDSTVRLLLQAAHERRRLVLRVPDLPDLHQVELAQPWELDATFRFKGELVAHLIRANAVELRDGRMCFWLAERALALGAVVGPTTDVVLPDGAAAWCDGGPVRFFEPAALGGNCLVHRISIEQGSLRPFGANTTTAPLSPDQLAAVTEPGAVARIIAPAGSGKTRVLTERVRHILCGWGLPARAVCLVAYNVRAAEEMRRRTPDLAGLQIRTLNSLALAIVNGTPPFAAGPGRRQTIDEPAVRDLLKGLVDLPRRTNTDPAAAWLEALSAVRLGLRDPAALEVEYNGDVDGLADVFPRYRSKLAEHSVLDYDEQIYLALEMLLQDAAVRAAAQRACRILLVDEFQDLTPAHVLLLALVAGPDAAVFGVGDDDQTIYGYADASPRWLLGFGDLFPGAAEHALGVNYRCPPAVVAAADRLLRRNRVRIPKAIRPMDGRASRLDDLVVLNGHAGRGESDDGWGGGEVAATTGHVGRLIEEGAAPAEIAVLTRVHSALVPVAVALAEAAVPVQHRLDESWLRRSGVAAALAWLRIAASAGRINAQDLRLALRRPPRGISPRVIDWMAEQGSIGGLAGLGERLGGRDAAKVFDVVSDIRGLDEAARAGATPSALLRVIRDELGLDRAMRTLEGSHRRLDRSAQTDDLDALVALGKLHPDLETFEPWLRSRLRVPATVEGVLLSTVHAVKGQEWPHVVVHAATEGLMPHRLAGDTEEERRIFHVAITRGMASVALSCGYPPSPFVAELFRQPEDDPKPQQHRSNGTQAARADPRPATPEGTPVTVGQSLTAGGYRGVVEDLIVDGVRLRVGAASILVPWEATIVVDGKRTRLARPPEDPATVARAEQLLREWRSQRARTEKRPAYTFLHDATLLGIAARLPGSLESLATIKGMGPSKLEQFGDEILAAVAEARREG